MHKNNHVGMMKCYLCIRKINNLQQVYKTPHSSTNYTDQMPLGYIHSKYTKLVCFLIRYLDTTNRVWTVFKGKQIIISYNHEQHFK